jgi:hypothetical protein
MIIGTTNLVINEIGAVFNVRIEGDTDANLFYTDATNSRVGVGTVGPTAKLDVVGGDIRIDNGNLIIGTSGKGIDFSATSHPAGMTSELLADYEEGTFTPSTGGFVEVLAGGTVTYSGTYTKVGRLVKVTIRIVTTGAATVAAAGGAACNLTIPFAPSVTDSGTWANTTSFTTSGAVTVNTNQNMYVVDSWAAANASWTLQATYAV